MECLEERQARNPAGMVNMHEALNHWAYDLMVCNLCHDSSRRSTHHPYPFSQGDMVFGGSNNLELMKRGDPRQMVEGGKKATILVDR